MFNKRKALTAFLFVLSILFSASSALAQQWEVQLQVPHRAQQEDWSCGPNTIAMWAGYIKRASIDTKQIADKYTGSNGTKPEEFMSAMFGLTPYGYVFSEWAYSNPYTAVKGIMATVARFNEPVAIAGNDGNHYYLVTGGVASRNPYLFYGKWSNIQYLYLLDSRENSPLYSNPRLLSSSWKYWLSVNYWPIFKKGQRYTPYEVIHNWTAIGAWNDKKWRSIERNTYAAWKSQGATYYNRDTFSSF